MSRDFDDLCEDLGPVEEDRDDRDDRRRRRRGGCGCGHHGNDNNNGRRDDDRDRDRDRDRRRDRFIPIGTVTVDCTPVVFKSNQAKCPHRCH